VPDAFTGMVRPSPLHTFYSRVGDLFALLDLAALFGLLVIAYRKKPAAG
jgi:hypothetical protein